MYSQHFNYTTIMSPPLGTKDNTLFTLKTLELSLIVIVNYNYKR